MDLIHQPVLNIDAAGASTRQIADQFFVRWRVLVGIRGDDVEKTLGLGLEI